MKSVPKPRRRGIEQGVEKGRLYALTELVRDGTLPLAQATERAGMTPEVFATHASADGLVIS